MVGFSRFIYCIFLRVPYSHSHSMFIVSYFRLSLHVFTGFIFVLVFFLVFVGGVFSVYLLHLFMGVLVYLLLLVLVILSCYCVASRLKVKQRERIKNFLSQIGQQCWLRNLPCAYSYTFTHAASLHTWSWLLTPALWACMLLKLLCL